jgi:hypothetical protein
MAENGSGVCTQTSSSASPFARSSHPGGATGTASTTCAAPCAQAIWQAARAVDPVAIPSSTTTANAAVKRLARPAAAVAQGTAVQLGPLSCLDRGQFLLGDPGDADDFRVEDLYAVLADGAHAQLWLERHPELADDDDIQRRAQGTGDLEGDRHAAARKAKH